MPLVNNRWLPSPQAKIVDKDGKPVPELFNYLDEVARRMGGQSGIADSCLLFSNQGVYTAAIIGNGLNLDRTTNTLTAVAGDGFPEAPLDGRQYGRQMAQWTVIVPGTSGGSPGAPRYSIQYNDPLGTFAGNAEYTIDPTNSILYLGAVNDWTLRPKDRTGANETGIGITIEGDKGTGTGAGGAVTLLGGDPGATITPPELGGRVNLLTSTGAWSTGNIVLNTGNSTANGFQSGSVQILTGTAVAAGGVTGSVEIATGDDNLSGGASGDLSFTTGLGYNGSGTVTLESGESSNGASGGVIIASGDAGSGSGDITLRIGTGVSADGSINLVFPAAGDLQINGSAGTAGLALTSNGAGLPPTWGASGGGGAGTAVGAPYFVPAATTIYIPLYFQALYVLPIELEGTLEINGYLIEMAG